MTTTMKILALDPATKTGFAHSCGASGVWDLSVRRDESSGMRLIRLVAKLRDIRQNIGVDVVVFEAARHAAQGMQGSLVTHAELQGQVKAWCETAGIEYRGYSPSEIKKHATGKGNGKKVHMLDAAAMKWPDKRISDDNECDALWLLDLATKELNGAP